jgi:hypothetical protein
LLATSLRIPFDWEINPKSLGHCNVRTQDFCARSDLEYI